MKKKLQKTRYFGVRAPEELYEKLKAQSDAERRSFSKQVVLLLEQALAK